MPERRIAKGYDLGDPKALAAMAKSVEGQRRHWSAVPLIWRWQTPAPELWGALIAIGMLATLAQLFLTRAYRSAPAAQVGPFTYLTVVFAAGIGWMFWAEVPDGLSLLGALLVMAGGAFTIRRAGRYAPATEVPTRKPAP